MFILILGLASAAGLHDPAFGFKHKSPKYYAEFANSCDSLLAQRNIGTNKFVDVPVTDASLPKLIRDVHPCKIKLERDSVWILAGDTSHALGYGIIWARQDGARTNVWTLSTTQESQSRVLYLAER